MKLTELGKANVPGVGKVNVFNPSSIWQLILGIVILLFAIATGQNMARAVSGRFNKIDTSPEPVFSSPSLASRKKIW